ncbi:flavin reductase family protein [Croceivirga thetidis]|uniref:Flavin reductase family protein n=1 Tax=Croceivirga thetidis TaxID=2721623 RepID=A0ABX1GLZ3_9FLAO|nr:flavin reductase family protein [Croceivirga thetidis]NKI30663.1 flavin reductase family protein [Croceivirga thetidis]
MTKTIDPNSISQPELHSILLTAVAPRPICFASTVDTNGNVNLSPYSFFNVFSSAPPVMIFSPSRSGRDGSLKHTHLNIREVPEVVINVVNHQIVEQMSLSSTAYAKGVNEFEKSGLTEVASDLVKPPRVGEAPVSFECTVREIIELAETPGAGNLIIVEVKRIHLNETYVTNGSLDTEKLDLVGRMGGSWYIKANGDALFEIPKPLRSKGIGVDALPQGIRESAILTGNNLGRLGNLEELSTATEIEIVAKQYPISSKSKLHEKAKQLLESGNSKEAMALLMYAETI